MKTICATLILNDFSININNNAEPYIEFKLNNSKLKIKEHHCETLINDFKLLGKKIFEKLNKNDILIFEQNTESYNNKSNIFNFKLPLLIPLNPLIFKTYCSYEENLSEFIKKNGLTFNDEREYDGYTDYESEINDDNPNNIPLYEEDGKKNLRPLIEVSLIIYVITTILKNHNDKTKKRLTKLLTTNTHNTLTDNLNILLDILCSYNNNIKTRLLINDNFQTSYTDISYNMIETVSTNFINLLKYNIKSVNQCSDCNDFLTNDNSIEYCDLCINCLEKYKYLYITELENKIKKIKDKNTIKKYHTKIKDFSDAKYGYQEINKRYKKRLSDKKYNSLKRKNNN